MEKREAEDIELIEYKFPGVFIGKEVIDGGARRIGIIRSIKISIPDFKVGIIIKGKNLEEKDVEFSVDSSRIRNVGTVVQLTDEIREFRELGIREVVVLQNEVKQEIMALFK